MEPFYFSNIAIRIAKISKHPTDLYTAVQSVRNSINKINRAINNQDWNSISESATDILNNVQYIEGMQSIK